MINKYIISKILALTFFTMSANTVDTIATPQNNFEKFPSTFEKIVNESESYKDLKLIKNSDLEIIKMANANDILSYKSSISSLQESIKNLNTELDLAKQNSELNKSISSNSSSAIPTILYIGIISLLILVLIIFVFQNNKIKETYKQHKSSLINVEEEYEDFKRSAIERELKLKREIMDIKNMHFSNSNTKAQTKTKALKKM